MWEVGLGSVEQKIEKEVGWHNRNVSPQVHGVTRSKREDKTIASTIKWYDMINSQRSPLTQKRKAWAQREDKLTSPPPSKRPIIHWRIKLGYMNSRRPFKPNLPSALKPSNLLALTGLRQTLSSLAYRILQSPIASTKMNWSLLNCFPSTK